MKFVYTDTKRPPLIVRLADFLPTTEFQKSAFKDGRIIANDNKLEGM